MKVPSDWNIIIIIKRIKLYFYQKIIVCKIYNTSVTYLNNNNNITMKCSKLIIYAGLFVVLFVGFQSSPVLAKKAAPNVAESEDVAVDVEPTKVVKPKGAVEVSTLYFVADLRQTITLLTIPLH